MKTLYIETKNLPDIIQRALASLSYGRRDIGVEPAETINLRAVSGDGYRAFNCLVDLAVGKYQTIWGSWGGPNPWANHNHTDMDDRAHPLELNRALIQGHRGGGQPVYATLYLHPSNLTPLLPAAPDISLWDRAVVTVFCHYRSAYRKEYLDRLGTSSRTAEAIERLISAGYLKRNRAGAISTTTLAHNAQLSQGEQWDVERAVRTGWDGTGPLPKRES